MADWPPKRNAAFTVVFPIYDADGDTVAAAAGLDSEFSEDGAAFGDCSNEAAEITGGNGIYELDLLSTEMDGDVVAVITKTSTGGAKAAVNVMYTVTRQLIDLAFPVTSGRGIEVEADNVVHADLKEWLGVAPLALTAQRVEALVGAMAAGVVTAAAVATDAIDADALAADAIDEIWDEPLAGHLTQGTAAHHLLRGLGLPGTVSDAGPAATDFDTAGFIEATDAHFAGAVLLFTEGVLLGQARIISTYTGAGQNCAFDRNFTEAPANGDEFIILSPLAGGLTRLITTEADGDAHADVQEWLGTAPLALSAQRVQVHVGAYDAGVIDAAAIANGAIDAATFAANAIDAAALAADAATEIADAVFQRDMDQVEGAAPLHSLAVAVLKAVSRVRNNAGTLEVYETDGVTLKLSQTITTDAANDPIDELTVGV